VGPRAIAAGRWPRREPWDVIENAAVDVTA
jgi:hypothetical protein